MFRKLLIANRGEIACRIMRSAQRLGIASVAVYAEADRHAPHCALADERVALGAGPASETYLHVPRLMAAIQKTGADAVHPGYGFLSENADFARAVAKAGCVFVGPPPNAMLAMGDKIAAKKLARAAGVPVIPGAASAVADAASAEAAAAELGYPVMLKAAGGGGGKGMRVVTRAAELADALAGAAREAEAGFSDARIFLEKFIARPRHIEIQILGDKQGRLVHFGERECSIQRRNQKVLEEAPSPFVTARLRARMGAAAVALARRVNYHSAGTVEFVVDPKGGFYFLEMNTRLQVEHGITELVYGVDLVEEMLRIAAGKPLRVRQAQIASKGWAVEVRLCAEDPTRAFLPSVGRLTHYAPPALLANARGTQENVRGTQKNARSQDKGARGATLRLDDGVQEGSEISVFYDSMIAKLMTHAANRRAAIDALADALDDFHIDGIQHNVDFLRALCSEKDFLSGATSTDFITRIWPQGFRYAAPSPTRQRALAAIAWLLQQRRLRRTKQSHVPPRLAVQLGESLFEVEAEQGSAADAPMRVALTDEKARRYRLTLASDWQPGARRFCGTVNDEIVRLGVRPLAEGFRLNGGGAVLDVSVRTLEAQALMRFMPSARASHSAKEVRCPMPGAVLAVAVQPGQAVKAGETLFVVEAMKMENIVRAEQDGKVERLHCAVGDKLAVDALMLEFA